MSEQRRIVAILDEAFEGIATAKANAGKNLQNARELFVSHLQSTYLKKSDGWTTSRIADIAQHSLGKMLDKAKNRGDLKPYLRNLNVRWFGFDLSDVQEMKFTPEESEKYTAIKGDVLICEGGYPGRCAIWQDEEPIYFQKALHRVRFHNSLHNKWFVNYMYLLDQTGDLKHHSQVLASSTSLAKHSPSSGSPFHLISKFKNYSAPPSNWKQNLLALNPSIVKNSQP